MLNEIREKFGLKIGVRFKIPKYSAYKFYFTEDKLMKDYGDGHPEVAYYALGCMVIDPKEVELLPFKPQKGDSYWTIMKKDNGEFVPVSIEWRNGTFDYFCFFAGYCFRTEDEALSAIPQYSEKVKSY